MPGHRPARLAGLLLTLLAGLTLVAVPTTVAPALAADLHGDDESDRYVGTGGLLLPATIGVHLRAEVAQCLGCRWRLASPCIQSEAGRPFSGTPVCLSVVRGCPAMAQLLRAWFMPASGTWREVGLVCIGVAGPVTVVGVGREVRERLSSDVPAQRPVAQPSTGVLTQIPVVFGSGQYDGDLSLTMVIAGESVALEATPRWRWDFGDDAILTTSDPGGSFPHVVASHAYRAAGSYRVRLTTTWSAQFSIDSLGPFPVDEPVVQNAAVTVVVGEGRAVLAVREAPWRE